MGVKQLLKRLEIIKSLPLTGRADGEAIGRGENTDTKAPTATGYSRHGWLPRRTAAASRAQSSNSSVALAGLFCLSLAIVSTMALNLFTTPSIPALAAGFTATGPATIGISLPGLTKDPNTGKYSVPTMTIPNNNGQGGIAITKHSIEVTSTSIGGYSTTIKADSNSNQLKGMVLILLTLLIQWLVLRLTQYH